eukprot:4944562-Prymnesium_polylepis.1
MERRVPLAPWRPSRPSARRPSRPRIPSARTLSLRRASSSRRPRSPPHPSTPRQPRSWPRAPPPARKRMPSPSPRRCRSTATGGRRAGRTWAHASRCRLGSGGRRGSSLPARRAWAASTRTGCPMAAAWAASLKCASPTSWKATRCAVALVKRAAREFPSALGTRAAPARAHLHPTPAPAPRTGGPNRVAVGGGLRRDDIRLREPLPLARCAGRGRAFGARAGGARAAAVRRRVDAHAGVALVRRRPERGCGCGVLVAVVRHQVALPRQVARPRLQPVLLGGRRCRPCHAGRRI